LYLKLKKSDVSKSGIVNQDEFKTAVSKSGIFGTPKQISELFDAHSEQLSDKTAIGMCANSECRSIHIIDAVTSIFP